MKRLIAAAMVMASGMAIAEENVANVKLTADLASAYVFRGATFNDGLVFQPGIKAIGLPVSVGVWANFDIDDYAGALAGSEFSEIDIYAGYDLPVAGLSLAYTEYTYIASGSEADREATISYAAPVLLTPSVSVNYGLDGAIKKSLYVEAGISHTVAAGESVSLSFGAKAGYADPDEGEAGFSHYLLSAGASYGIFSAGLNYNGQIDDDVLPDVEDEGLYDVGLYGTIGVSKEF